MLFIKTIVISDEHFLQWMFDLFVTESVAVKNISGTGTAYFASLEANQFCKYVVRATLTKKFRESNPHFIDTTGFFGCGMSEEEALNSVKIKIRTDVAWRNERGRNEVNDYVE